MNAVAGAQPGRVQLIMDESKCRMDSSVQEIPGKGGAPALKEGHVAAEFGAIDVAAAVEIHQVEHLSYLAHLHPLARSILFNGLASAP